MQQLTIGCDFITKVADCKIVAMVVESWSALPNIEYFPLPKKTKNGCL